MKNSSRPAVAAGSFLNRKRAIISVAIALSAALISGCGGAGDTPQSASNLTAPDVEAAKAEGSVTLYTSVDVKALDAINAAFTKKYGIKVEYFRGDSQDAVSKLITEGRAQSIKADVIETSDVPGMNYLKAEGLTQPYVSAESDKIRSDFKDPDNYYTYTRLTLGVISYNKELVANPPTSWADLADPKFSSQLAFFSDAQGSGAARLWTLGENIGWDQLEKWGASKPLQVETPQLLRQTLERGERGIGIAQNDNHALSSQVDSGKTGYTIPSEGVPLEPAAISVVKNAPHPNAAMLYYDFWLSQEGMEIMADVGKKYVSRDGVPQPAGSVPLDEIKLMVPDYKKYAEERSEAQGKLAKIFGGEWGQ